MTSQESWLQAQYSVLGSVLLEPELAPKVIQQTKPTDFIGECRTVYNAMLQLFQNSTPVDAVSLAHALGPQYRELLMQLMQITPSAANIDTYIQICREQAKVVSIRGIAEKLLTAIDSNEVRKLLDEANTMMMDKQALQIATMQDALKSFFERHTGEAKYLTWPIRELNDRLFCKAGNYYIIGGRPSTGKTAWALQCAEHWAQNKKVGIFSLETDNETLFDRMMSFKASINMNNIMLNNLSGKQWDDAAAVSREFLTKNLELICLADPTVADIRSVTAMYGYDVIIIDYVQLISSTSANRTEAVTNISLALHRMAQSMKVIVVGLAQLKRIDHNSTPDSSDLRESGQLEQDADVVMILQLEDQNNEASNRKLYITKNKQGTCFKTTLAFDGAHQRFYKANATVREREANETGRNMKKGDNFAVANEKAKKSVQGSYIEIPEQMQLLPDSTEVPFKERKENEK